MIECRSVSLPLDPFHVVLATLAFGSFVCVYWRDLPIYGTPGLKSIDVSRRWRSFIENYVAGRVSSKNTG